MVIIVLSYIVFTVIGLQPFKGVPIPNVALGFLLGAFITRHYESRHYPRLFRSGEGSEPAASGQVSPDQTSLHVLDYYRDLLRNLISWSLMAAGITMVVCWALLIGAKLVPYEFWINTPLAKWLMIILTAESELEFRARLFAILISPGLQILTTVFGGVVTILFTHKKTQ